MISRPEYNLVPKYRFTGKRLLFLWHTHNEQHQLVVARTLEQVISMWEHILHTEGLEATSRALWMASLVLPPKWVCERHSDNLYANDMSNFKHHITYSIKQYIERNHKIPSGVVRCKEFIQDPDANYTDPDEHYGCLNCYNGFAVSRNWDEMMNDNFDFVASSHIKVRPSFDGIMASNDKQLYVCNLNGSNHSNGITLSSIEKKEGGKFDTANALFFFHGEQIAIPKKIIDLRDSMEKKAKEKAEHAKKANDERWAANRRKEDDWLLKVLEG